MAFYLDGLYPGPLLRDHQAKVHALPAMCFSGQLQSPEGDCRPAARGWRAQSVLLPSAPQRTAGATAVR
jgi:hypothetical protein